VENKQDWSLINDEYLKLLNCNLEKVSDFNLGILKEELEIYKSSLNDWATVNGVTEKLENYKHPVFEYPNIHPMTRKIVNTVTSLPVKTVCEIGAGGGRVAKYVYNANRNIELTCVEGSDLHIKHMKQNFDADCDIILPKMAVKANIIKGLAQDIPLSSVSQDLVFTCTVLMHIPYLMAIKAIQDIARVSKKYVLHVERKDGNVILGNQKSSLNLLQIDYQSVYEKLGFMTIRYEEFTYPEYENLTCVYYLGEKLDIK
jgi:hypothetical protein